MTDLLFVGGLFLGSGIVWLAAVVIDARETRKRAALLGRALTPGVTDAASYTCPPDLISFTSGTSADATDGYYASEQGEQPHD